MKIINARKDNSNKTNLIVSRYCKQQSKVGINIAFLETLKNKINIILFIKLR